ncbi:MAG TPA: twin-arginine translocase TatA/TatE family subunit [Candidatus Hydrogenedens sp.]|nr:twin-arginine translocase TatA/TatE family subunit [Candidatus Hydrogenedens sp.]HOL19863.1 twin-arginine translocase TatA/TatE family subunit [Candidatus Hydrogenedens sp.]HPP59437.1 twin-arginine translocase TatA/TatE family subunit [Candidatus Hydrogenedens sp.]
MWTPGMGELFIILIIVLVLFGGNKIAGLGRSLGTAIAEFKDAVKGGEETKKESIEENKKEEKS